MFIENANNILMSDDEIAKLIDEATAAFDQGDEEKGYEISKRIPLAPELAMCAATQFGYGPEALKKSGINLSEAEAKYGKDWLERI